MLCQDLCRLLGLKRKRVERSRELLLPTGLASEAELGLEGRGDEKFELEGTDEQSQSGTALPWEGKCRWCRDGRAAALGRGLHGNHPKCTFSFIPVKQNGQREIFGCWLCLQRDKGKKIQNIQSNPGFFPFVST